MYKEAFSFEAGHFWLAEMARYVSRLAAEQTLPLFIILIHQLAVCGIP